MPKRHHHTESRLNNLSVNADPEHPVYREATTEIQKRLRYMTEKHSQVFVGHLEFRFPPEMETQNDNRHISNAVRKCRMKLKLRGSTPSLSGHGNNVIPINRIITVIQSVMAIKYSMFSGWPDSSMRSGPVRLTHPLNPIMYGIALRRNGRTTIPAYGFAVMVQMRKRNCITPLTG